LTENRAIIFVPPGLARDYIYADECLTFAGAHGLHGVVFRCPDVVDHLLDTDWSRRVIVARLRHVANIGWPFEVVDETTTKQIGGVQPLPHEGLGGRHRAASDSLIGQLMRHPTMEMSSRTPAQQFLDQTAQRWRQSGIHV
jgi:hypothetical protein